MVAVASATRRNVLICDDDRPRAVTLGALVGLRRHAVRIAQTVDHARAECLRAPPDVLVFDLSVGSEAAASLVAWLRTHAPAVRRVVVCGTAAEASGWRARGNADQTLLSPVPIHELWAFVESPTARSK